MRGPVGEAPELESGGGEGGGGFLSVVARARLWLWRRRRRRRLRRPRAPGNPLPSSRAPAGAEMRAMLAEDAIDERMAVMLLLIFEARRVESGRKRADALPARRVSRRRSSTAKTLRWLEGTNLHAAALAQRSSSIRAARARAPRGKSSCARCARRRSGRGGRHGARAADGGFVCEKVFEKAGRPGLSAAISEEEFRRAYACFWSRALALPRERPRALVLGGGYRARNSFANHSCAKPNAMCCGADPRRGKTSPAAMATSALWRSHDRAGVRSRRCPRPARS